MCKQITAALLPLVLLPADFAELLLSRIIMPTQPCMRKPASINARLAMHCNGKCQMMKKLEQEEKNDQDNLERKSENKNEIQLANSLTQTTVVTPDVLNKNAACKMAA